MSGDIEPGSASFKMSGTLDIETGSWSHFALACIYDGHRPKIFYDGDEMIDELRRRGGIWYAHAGGTFDLLYVLERARARGIACQIDRSQHRVTRIVMGKLTLRDSYSIWPVPLDEICGALGRAAPTLPWKCICGRDCGAYCQIHARMRERTDGTPIMPWDPDLEDYCKADAIALYDGMLALADFAASCKIKLAGTLGQTAWQAAQDELGVPASTIPWEIWRHARLADKGGRIAVVKPRARGPGAHHDICNAYPGQLAKAHLPVGNVRQIGAKYAKNALGNEAPGIYSLSVRVPEDAFLPPLPWTRGGHLTFPTGEFDGTWALPEITAALERGAEIVKVHSALIWEATAPVFGPLVERWYEIRRAVGRKTPFGQWIGRLAKALTGKFSERPVRERVTMHPEAIKVCTGQGPCRQKCTWRCGAYKQLDLFGHIWGIPYQHLSDCAYPQWSAYLRAQTRVQWLSQAERMGRDLCMGNTDSLWHTSRETPEPLGDGLGQWEFQNSFYDLEVRSPTAYAFRKTADGPLEIHGIPGITEEDWRRGGGVIDRGIVTLGRAMGTTKGLFQKRSRKWTLPDTERTMYGDRRMGAGGLTYPLDAQELREFAKKKARVA
jgi:hypothetical protein